MLNYYEHVQGHPEYFRQFRCGESLITQYNCPLENKFVDLWSKHDYIAYVIDGHKIWHTAQGTYDLKKGTCVFVRKGASIVEQFFDAPYCVLIFFLTDEFICQTLQTRSVPPARIDRSKYDPVIMIEKSPGLENFILSMSSYFAGQKAPDPSLLELKFRELILTIAEDPRNINLLSYFSSLMSEPREISMQRVMEDNYCYNLKLEQYAELCARSLSAFKRDFQKIFGTTPGKWLLEKRLLYARHLLLNMNKSVSDAAFESGFENPSHFSRSFKERFGHPPTATRRSLVP